VATKTTRFRQTNLDPQRWNLLKTILGEALEKNSSAARSVLLESRCGEDTDLFEEAESLLAEAEALLNEHTDSFEDCAEKAASTFWQEGPPRGGQRIGAYVIVRELGRGGMGTVFLAERADGQFEKQVAIKILNRGADTAEILRRFQAERQILARLDHPNIARLLDAGTTEDGLPYFIMDYIVGVPVTRFAVAQKLSTRQRLELFLKICTAVEFAHRNLVVHRDIKPSNILANAEGEPKLLDFGIAKPLVDRAGDADQTGTQFRPMTRDYAAPEQVLGEAVTTATDVYALGVLLYRLLCGRMPYRRAALGQISWTKAILEEAPEPLDRAIDRTGANESSFAALEVAAVRATSVQALKRTLRGDLQRIVQRALAKSPDARYATVSAFAGDLGAFVEGRALSGGTRTYQLRKFARRHWLPLTGASTLLAVILASGLALAWEAARTAREAKTTAAVKDFLLGLFSAVDPHEAKGKDISARELLDRGAQHIDEVRDQPVLATELQSVLGRIYFQLGLYAQASALQQRAIDALKSDGTQPLLLAHVQIDRAETVLLSGDLKLAGALALEASAIVEAMPAAADTERVRALNALSKTNVMSGDYPEAKRYSAAAMVIAQRSRLEDALMADTLKQAGNAAWGVKSLDQARELYGESLAVSLHAQGPDSPMVASLHENLAHVFSAQARYGPAVQEMQQALAISTKILGAQHPSVLTQQGYLGLYNFDLGDYRTARTLLESVVAQQRAQAGAQSPVVALALGNLGVVLAESTDLDAAENAFAEALRIDETTNGRESEAAQIALGNLAYVHRLKGELDRAQTELLEVKRNEEKRSIDDDPELYYQLGEVQRLRGNAAEAVELDRKALQFAQMDPGESSDSAALAHDYLGLALRDAGDTASAERELRASLASFAGYVPNAEHPRAATTRLELALLLAKHAESHEEAAKLAADAAAIRERFLGKDDSRTRDAQAIAAKMGAGH
jgi:serine/threonine protein kinase